MKTNTKLTTKKKNGFTLIEVIAVLVLLGILAAVAVPKYINMTEEARATAVDAGIAELNSREALEWSKESLKTGGWANDVTADLNIGAQYVVTTTSITFQGNTAIALSRSPASAAGPGIWTK